MRFQRFIGLSAAVLLLLAMMNVFIAVYGFTPPTGWSSYKEVTLTETIGLIRVDEPVEVVFEPEPGTCSSTDEIRVIAPDEVTEIPSQAYDVTTSGGYITSCKVVFLADCPALSTVTYYIIYNNPAATIPTYDGLRLYEEIAGDTYDINATKEGIEKKYFRIFWQSLIWLYSNGENLTWAGGPLGWEFGQIYLATLWGGYNDTAWFGANKSLSILNGGPVFVDFNFSEAGGSDFFGAVFDYNITTTSIVRVFYQPDLNPLIHYVKTFSIRTNLANYTLGSPYYLDFKLADRASQAIYKNFTWKNTGGTVTSISTIAFPESDTIWDPVHPIGWWSFNGSIPGSDGQPAANVGLIPISSTGAITDADYRLRFTHLLEDDDHHCFQSFAGDYNGVFGDSINTTGYIFTHIPVDANAEPIMKDKTLKSRYPLNSHPADITGPAGVPDGKVDMRDIGMAARYFGQNVPPAPTNCDMTGQTSLDPDGKVDMRDIGYAARAFGWQR